MNELKINKIPSLTWHFLRMNEARVKWQQPERAAEVTAQGADVDITTNNGAKGYFPSDDADSLFDGECAVLSVTADEGEEKTARFNFSDCDLSSAAKLYITGKKSSKLTVYVTFTGNQYLAFKSITEVCDDADVKIILTQLTEKGGKLICTGEANVGKNACLSMFRFCPGTAGTYAQSRVVLRGDESKLYSRTAYIGRKNQALDMNYVAAHIGRRTECDIEANGVLDDNASKAFRGTIDFRCGSSGSIGSEVENVLLFGENIVNKTLPVILCDEEDVNGSHGATIGQISNETLLYFASRGISEEQARSLLTHSVSDAFCRLVNDDETTAQINKRTEGDYYDE